MHEEDAYGNIHEEPLRDVFNKDMKKWRDGSLHYSGCSECPYSNICDSGCRMSALGAYGDHRAKDPLYVGPHVFKEVYKLEPDADFLEKAKAGLPLMAANTLRFRKEDGFYLVNIRWGNSITVNDEIGAALFNSFETQAPFYLSDFGPEAEDLIANLFYKGAIVSPDFEDSAKRNKLGLSLNIEALPKAV